jgi:hypothetical protein
MMAGSIRVSLGSPLPLTLQIDDGNIAVFPRASVYDSTFTEVGGSPFNLTHVANGLYKNTTGFTPSSEGLFTAVYTVYSDSGHTTVLKRYARVTDLFDVNPMLQDIEEDTSDDGRAV